MDSEARPSTWTVARAVMVVALTLLAARTVEVLVFCYQHSFFIGDDVAEFWQSRTLPFTEFLMTPVDVHFVPLHRLVSFVVWRVAPMNYGLGLGVLAAFHVTAMVTLWKILRELHPSPFNAVLLAGYGMNGMLVGLFLWWMAGLHRLPCVCFSALAIHAYLVFRRTGSRKWAALFTCHALLALGFYSKGALVLPNVVLLELLLFATPAGATGRAVATRRARATALGLTFVLVSAYLLVWRRTVGPQLSAIRLDLPFHGRFIQAGTGRYLRGALGIWEHILFPWGDLFLLVGWIVILRFAWKASRSAKWGLLATMLSIAGSLLGISLSAAKTGFFEDATVMPDRYYFEPSVFVLVFLGATFRGLDLGKWQRPLTLRNVLAARSAWVSLLVLFIGNYCALDGEREMLANTGYSSHEKMRAFVHTLRDSVAKLPPSDRDPIVLFDTGAPSFVMPLGPLVRKNSEVLILLGERVRTSKDASYVVEDSGEIVHSPSWHRRHHRRKK